MGPRNQGTPKKKIVQAFRSGLVVIKLYDTLLTRNALGKSHGLGIC